MQNDNFRKVVDTGKYSQVVIMSINPGEDIGEEVHKTNDQTLYLVSGSGKSVINGKPAEYNSGDVAFVPAGSMHNFINTGSSDLKIITIYGPPHHAPDTVHKTKSDALLDIGDKPPAK